MKNKMFNFFQKKDKGFAVGDGMVLLFSMLAVTLMVVIGMTAYSNLVKKDNVTLVARQCIIKMETDGGLNSEVEADYVAQLNAAGLTDVSFDGSTKITGVTSPVPYGGKIILKLTGKMEIRNCSMRGFRVVIERKSVPVNIFMTSTSKC